MLLALFSHPPLFFALLLGSWRQKGKDKANAVKEGAEKFASKNLNFVITSWLKISYKGLMRLKKVFACYMDLTTDSILMYSIWYTVGDGTFESFSYQVAVILLVSIIIPIYSSAIFIAILVLVGNGVTIISLMLFIRFFFRKLAILEHNLF